MATGGLLFKGVNVDRNFRVAFASPVREILPLDAVIQMFPQPLPSVTVPVLSEKK